jgi:hypothetical protein
MCEPQCLKTLWASRACYRDSFIYFLMKRCTGILIWNTILANAQTHRGRRIRTWLSTAGYQVEIRTDYFLNTYQRDYCFTHIILGLDGLKKITRNPSFGSKFKPWISRYRPYNGLILHPKKNLVDCLRLENFYGPRQRMKRLDSGKKAANITIWQQSLQCLIVKPRRIDSPPFNKAVSQSCL